MREKVVGTYISLVISIVSVVVLALGFTVIRSDILVNIGYGILGSGLVSFVLTFSEYFTVKRETLTDFYISAHNSLKMITAIRPLSDVKEMELLASYIWERKGDDWRKIYFQPLETTCFLALCELYNTWGFFSADHNMMDDPQAMAVIETRRGIVEKDIKNAMRSCIQAGEVSLQELDNCYGKIAFLVDVKKTRRNKIFAIYEDIRNCVNSIRQENYHFTLYLNGEADNLPVIVNKLKTIDSMLYVAKEDDTWAYTMAQFADDLRDKLEEMRSRIIYNQKFEPYEREPVSGIYKVFRDTSRSEDEPNK